MCYIELITKQRLQHDKRLLAIIMIQKGSKQREVANMLKLCLNRDQKIMELISTDPLR